VRVRIGLPRAIRADDRGEVGVAKEQRVVALVGLEIWIEMSTLTPPSDATNVLNSSSRMSFPILNYTRRDLVGRTRRGQKDGSLEIVTTGNALLWRALTSSCSSSALKRSKIGWS
jgi:hypothetical protein